ncbi:hypothetical protein B0H14DRAFT_3125436 [Mycena olivaceomarginata]|nr:hypothetical protein B0H14DRAFT_3125436 [Mycena olivaceomarginata]
MFHKLQILTAFFTFLVLGQGAFAVPQSSDIVCGRPTDPPCPPPHVVLQSREISTPTHGRKSLFLAWTPSSTVKSWLLLHEQAPIFHEWALDELWKHQHTIENLIQCMPATYGTPRTASLDSLDSRLLFKKYAARVRSLLCVYEIDAPLVNIYEILAKSRFDCPLPILEHLSWNGYSVDIPLHFTNVPPWATDYVVNGDAEYSELLQLWKFVRACPHLESLDVWIVDCETLEYLGPSSLPQEAAHYHSRSDPSSGAAARSMFSNLRELSFRPEQQDPGGGEIPPIIAFLRACNNPPLRSFEAPYIIEWNLKQVEELYQVLAGHILHNHLAMLQFEFLETGPAGHASPSRTFLPPPIQFHPPHCHRNPSASGYDFKDAIVAEMAHTPSPTSGIRSQIPLKLPTPLHSAVPPRLFPTLPPPPGLSLLP